MSRSHANHDRSLQNENFTPPDPAYAKEWGIHWDPLVHGEGGPVQQSFPVFQYPSVSKSLKSRFFAVVQNSDLGRELVPVLDEPEHLDAE